MAQWSSPPRRDRSVVRHAGWMLAGVALLFSGLRHLYLQHIYGRVRLLDSVPLLQGWPVVLLGLLEFACGVWLIYRMIKRTD
jgi:hypothetical protein